MKRVASLITLAAAFSFTACEAPTALDDSVTQPVSAVANAVVENGRFPFDFFIPPCNGEAIDGSGIFHVVDAHTESASGQLLFAFHLNAKGKGTGQTTGAKYQWNDVIHDVANLDGNDGFPLTVNFRQRFHLIGQGRVPNRIVKVDFQFTVNANGTETQFKFKFVDPCPEVGP